MQGRGYGYCQPLSIAAPRSDMRLSKLILALLLVGAALAIALSLPLPEAKIGRAHV